MAADSSGRAIFISYRRDDSEGEAGRLFDDLVRAYGEDSVFMDVSGIDPGTDFRKAIDANVASCGVLLAMIGPTWATVTDSGGVRRLDNPSDFVRLEIASALARQVAVIPVLVHGAKMPPLDLLPDDLKDLRYRNSVELTHARWNSDVALLVTALKNYVHVNHAHETETVHATVSVQLPAPQPTPHDSEKKHSPLYPLGIVALIVLLAIGGLLVWLHFRSTPSDQAVAQAQPTSQPASAATGTPAPTTAAQPGTSTPVQPTPAQPALASFLGNWKNANDPAGGSDDLVQLSIIDFGGQLVVRPKGQCPKKICEWGPKNATIQGSDAVTETWTLHNTENETKLQRTATISLRPTGDGLNVTVHNVWHEPNGKIKQGYANLQFVKAEK